MDDILKCVPCTESSGVIWIADDFVVYGSTPEDYDIALHKLMQSAQHNGLVFRPEKCLIRQGEVQFFGMMWNESGMKPDPKKCDDIKSRKKTKNATELLSFLGLVNYLAPFIPNLSES